MTTVAPSPQRVQISQTRNLIDGKWVDALSGETFETYNPATGEVIAQVASANAEDVDRAEPALGDEGGRYAVVVLLFADGDE